MYICTLALGMSKVLAKTLCFFIIFASNIVETFLDIMYYEPERREKVFPHIRPNFY